jgi:hypothetical protein
MTVAGLAMLATRVTDAIAGLEDHNPADFLDDTDLLIVSPMADGTEWGHDTEVTGAVLGYWPPTSAALITWNACDDHRVERYERERFVLWDNLRWHVADLLRDTASLAS